MTLCRQCGGELPKDANFCPVCGTQVIDAKPVERHRLLKVAGTPKVVVTNIAPGSVKIESTAKTDEVTVDLDLKLPQHLDCNISQDQNVVTVACRAKAGVWSWPLAAFNSGPRANILVSVPSEANLDLEARAGRITVSGVTGTLAAESSAGSLHIQNCGGAIKTRTQAGSINLKSVDGTVTARSAAGSIKFSGTLSKGENWFRTSVGSIDLSLEGQSDLTVDASTRLGSIRCTPELANTYQRRNHLTGCIGAGAGRLIAETKTGSITIRH